MVSASAIVLSADDAVNSVYLHPVRSSAEVRNTGNRIRAHMGRVRLDMPVTSSIRKRAERLPVLQMVCNIVVFFIFKHFSVGFIDKFVQIELTLAAGNTIGDGMIFCVQ